MASPDTASAGQTIPKCPFCKRIEEGVSVERNDLAAAFLDAYPLADGHWLVVPLRHEPDYFRLTTGEHHAILALVRALQERLSKTVHPDGFNVGINVGEAAGQTVGHAHVHLIPRKDGDVEDPRGGVRWVIPERAAYWNA